MELLVLKRIVRLGSSPRRVTIYKDGKMKRIIEIRSAEGGEDARLFGNDLLQAYKKLAIKFG